MGEKVKVVYDNIEEEILIKENKDKNNIIVVYNDKEFTISKSHFKDCNISHILNYVEWNYEIGEDIKDEKRDLKIIKREKFNHIGCFTLFFCLKFYVKINMYFDEKGEELESLIERLLIDILEKK